MRGRLQAIAVAVLAGGLFFAVLVYFGAGDEAGAPDIDALLGSKLYARQLQQFGGKASLLFDDFMRWFGGLWHGRALGVTVGCLSVAVSGLLFYLARRAPKE